MGSLFTEYTLPLRSSITGTLADWRQRWEQLEASQPKPGSLQGRQALLETPSPEQQLSEAPRYLDQVNGLRALACLWILTTHWAEASLDDSRIVRRGYIGVTFFIVLSGFTTHYACLCKDFKTCRVVCRFHLQRVGRILPLHWFALTLSILIGHGASEVFPKNLLRHPRNAIGSFFLATSWYCYQPFPEDEDALFRHFFRHFDEEQCPFTVLNNVHWTLSTLLFSWLLYPLLRRPLPSPHCGVGYQFLFVLVVLLPLCELPLLLLMRAARPPADATSWFGFSETPTLLAAVRSRIGAGAFQLLYEWPPCRVPDFLFGMALGQLARNRRVLAWGGWPRLVDLSVLLILLILLKTPYSSDEGARTGHEALFVSGLNLLLGVVLLGSNADCAADRSFVAYLASMPLLHKAGKFSFHVYLLQEVVAKLFLALQFHVRRECDSMAHCIHVGSGNAYTSKGHFSSQYWIPFLFALWTLGATWYSHVEEPWVRWLRARLAFKHLPCSGKQGRAMPRGSDSRSARVDSPGFGMGGALL